MINWEVAEELLAIYGSPLYVYDAEILRQTIKNITQAIPYPSTQFHFASVTNGNLALLRIFRDAGWGLHANTPGDVYLGLHAGFEPDRIVYSGSNLNFVEMEQLLNWGIKTLNLDSLSQLQLCCQAIDHLQIPPPLLGLRLNLPEITGNSRIGVRPQEFPAAIKIADEAGLKISGLHFYRGTGTNATTAFTDAIARILTIAQQLPDWQYLDFGGGFGYPYHRDRALKDYATHLSSNGDKAYPAGNRPAFNWELFGTQLTQKIEAMEKQINLIIEPGRAAIAGCATLYGRVVSIKWQENKQIVGVDTTVANLSIPSVHGGYREIIANTQSAQKYTSDVCGNTTYSRDYLGKNCQLPALKIGDTIGILDVGAYGYAMSSHFLHRPKPAEVLLNKSKHRLIRKREDYSVLLSD